MAAHLWWRTRIVSRIWRYGPGVDRLAHGGGVLLLPRGAVCGEDTEAQVQGTLKFKLKGEQ